jgi:hypothetical protein
MLVKRTAKPFWKSKTFASALASALFVALDLAPTLPGLQPYLPYLAFASAVAAAAFRTTASQPLSARRRDGERSTWST